MLIRKQLLIFFYVLFPAVSAESIVYPEGCIIASDNTFFLAAFITLILLLVIFIIWNRRLAGINRARAVEIRDSNIAAQRLNFALEAGGIGLWETGFDGKDDYFSDEMFRMLGYEPLPPKEAHLFFASIIHPADTAGFKRLVDDFLSGRQQGLYRIEFRLLHNSGYYSNILSSGRPLERDGKGRILRMVGVHVDVTDFRMAEVALRESQDKLKTLVNDLREANDRISLEIEERKRSEKRFRDIADLLPQMIYECDASGFITYTNKYGYELSGFGEDSLGRVNLRQFLSEEDYKTAEENIRLVMSGGNMIKTEYAFIRRDGSRVPVLIYSSPVFRDNTFSGLRGIVIDISDRKKVEEAIIAANNAKSDFLANVSHEIRTPMNAIMGLANIVLSGHLEPEQRKYVDKINSSAMLLLGIINDMLDYSKIEAGRLELEEIDFRLEDVLVNMSELLSFSADEHEMEILIDIAPDVPCMITGDPLRLGQVLVNLVSNAIKFGGGRDVHVRVWLPEIYHDENGVTISFSVTDSGIGMTGEQLSRLFKPFTQADSSTTRRFGGTGLGLVISKQIADLMYGEISVNSSPGDGSTFTFTAKFRLAAIEDGPAGDLRCDFSGIRILLVDDSDVSCAAISSAIRLHGAECISLTDPSEAPAVFVESMKAGNPFHVVIADYRMPGINGLECINMIRRECRCAFRSVLMASPYGRDIIVQKAADAGVDVFLDRPVFASALRSTLNELLKKDLPETIEDLPPAEGNSPRNRDIDELKKIDGLRMLIVEDNRTNQLVIATFAKKAGIRTSFAENGQLCLDAAEREKFDIILMDIQMPVMDGYEASMELRKRGVTTPIIAVSAHAFTGEREHCISAGMNDYISKPVSPTDLYKKILDLVRRDTPRS